MRFSVLPRCSYHEQGRLLGAMAYLWNASKYQGHVLSRIEVHAVVVEQKLADFILHLRSEGRLEALLHKSTPLLMCFQNLGGASMLLHITCTWTPCTTLPFAKSRLLLCIFVDSVYFCNCWNTSASLLPRSPERWDLHLGFKLTPNP